MIPFGFVEATLSKDSKLNVLYIIFIITEEGENYELPEKYKNTSLYSELKKTDLYNKVKANIMIENMIEE